MAFIKAVVVVMVSFLLYIVDSRGIAGNIKLVAMNGNQYWFSSSSPYAPNLNYHLAYQYCRTLGLQLVVLETKEEVDTISAYLNSFEGKRDVGSVMNRNNYWTSGNRLGANSWLWMSSGEQLNGSFSDFPLLKQATDGPISTNSKNCLSMKSTVAKRAIFTPDECEKSLPFICEQVRCLYYNYPVTQFPDPNDLRSDLEEGVGVTQSESESRASLNYVPSEKLRSQNYISSSSRNANTLRLAHLASLDTRKTDPSKIQRRITLRPIPSTFPYTASDYVNSFYKYQTIDYSATSTDRPSFKKTTRETLWSPWPSITDSLLNNNNSKNDKSSSTTPIPSDGSVTATIHKSREHHRNITYVTATALTPTSKSKSTTATTYKTTVRSSSAPSSSETTTHPLQNISSRRRANLEIVKIRATERNSEKTVGPTTIQPFSAEDSTGFTGRTTLEVTYSRRGPTFRKGSSSSSSSVERYTTESPTTLDPNKIVFDDEENNVGGEVDDSIIEDVVLRDATTTTTESAGVTDGAQTESMFFQGNGIRRPDTNSFFTEIGIPTKRSTTSTSARRRSDEFIQDNDREASQTQTPAALKQMFNFQRSKANRKPISWAALRSRKSGQKQEQAQGRSISVTASTGPTKIALGPRLKFRTKSASSQ